MPIATVQPPLSIRKAVDASSSATSSAAASAVASQSNNSNQRAKYQDSIDFEDDDDDPLFSSTTSTSKIFSQFGTTTTSRPPSSGLVIGGSSGQVGYVSSVFPSGSGETKLPAAGISQFFLGGGNASSTTDKKRATEFDVRETIHRYHLYVWLRICLYVCMYVCAKKCHEVIACLYVSFNSLFTWVCCYRNCLCIHVFHLYARIYVCVICM